MSEEKSTPLPGEPSNKPDTDRGVSRNRNFAYEFGSSFTSTVFGDALVNKAMQYSLNGIVTVTIIIVFVFFVWGIACTILFTRTFVGEELVQRNIGGVFDVVSLVIAFVYRDWLTNAVLEFNSRPKQYNTVLSYLKKTSEITASAFMSSLCNLDHNEELIVRLKYLFDLYRAFNYFLLQIFRPRDEFIKRPYEDNVEKLLQKHSISPGDPVHDCNLLIVEMRTTVMKIRNDLRVIDSQQEKFIINGINQISEFLEQVNIASTSKQPDIFSYHLMFIMFLYIVVVIPCLMYSEVNTMMPILYPIILFLFLGAIIFRWRIGDPFEDNNYHGFNPEGVRADALVSLNNMENYMFSRCTTEKYLRDYTVTIQ